MLFPQKSTGQGSNSTALRSYNVRTILHLLRFLRSATRSELVKHTSLTSQTVAVITEELMRRNLIKKVGTKNLGVGQPSYLYELNSNGTFSFGVNIGRKNLDMVLINFDGKIFAKKNIDYSYPQSEMVIEAIKKFTTEQTLELDAQFKESIAGLGVGIPDNLNLWENELEEIKDELKDWNDIEFKKQLTEEVDLPIVFENDMNVATIASQILGKGIEFKDFLYIYLGTFIGGGLVLDGNIYHGKNKLAGNVATMMSVIQEGNDFALGQLVSVASINRLKKYLVKKGVVVPKLHHDFVQLISASNESVDVHILEWIKDISYPLASALITINSILDLQSFIIDSSLPTKWTSIVCHEVKEKFKKFDLTGVPYPNIVQGNLGGKARAMGGALLPFYSQILPDSWKIENKKLFQIESSL